MAQTTVYPFGQGGNLPSGYPIVNDRTTGGADKAWSAEQGKIACEDIDQINDELYGEVEQPITLVKNSRVESSALRTTGVVETVQTESSIVDKFIGIVPGETYYVTGRVGTGVNACLVCFYDANDNFITGSAHFTTDGVATAFLDEAVVAPAGAYIMRVAGNKNTYGTAPYPPAVKKEVREGGLTQRVDSIEERMDAVEEKTAFVPAFDIIAIPALCLPVYINTSTLKWVSPSSANDESSAIFKVNKGQRLQIVANATNNTRYAFLSDYHGASNGTDPAFLSGYEETYPVQNGTTAIITIPEDCFMYVILKPGSTDYTPTHIYNEGNNFFKGLKIVWQGPSTMQGIGCKVQSNRFSDRVAKYLGMTSANYAITGSTVGKKPGSYESAFVSLDAWQAAVSGGQVDTSKTYLVKDNGSADFPWAIYSYSGGSWSAGSRTPSGAQRTPMADRISEMATDADVIIVQGGTNDFQYDWDELGENGDTDITTVKGATRAICEFLVNTYPKKTIVWLTSMASFRYQGTHTTPYSQNALGYTGWESIDAEMEVCEEYGIPVIDYGAEIGLSPANPWWDDYDSSGTRVHPNDEGHLIAAAYLVEKLLTMKKSL